MDAEHEESAPNASTLLISQLTCSLVGQTQTIMIKPGTLAHQIVGQDEITEEYFCSYGLNPAFRHIIGSRDLKITGVDAEDDVRIVELPGHRFFLATLFLPQWTSSPGDPHPIIMAYLRAALDRMKREVGKKTAV